MGRGRVMENDLEDLGAEEVCQAIRVTVACTILFGYGEGRRWCVVLARHVLLCEWSIARSYLIVIGVCGYNCLAAQAVAVDINVVVKAVLAVLSRHLAGYQRHSPNDVNRQACRIKDVTMSGEWEMTPC